MVGWISCWDSEGLWLWDVKIAKYLMCAYRKVTVKSMSFPNWHILIKKEKKDLWVEEFLGHSFHCVLQNETQEKNIRVRLSLGAQLWLSEKGVEGGPKSQLSKEAFPVPHRVNTQHSLWNCSPVSSRFWISTFFEFWNSTRIWTLLVPPLHTGHDCIWECKS